MNVPLSSDLDHQEANCCNLLMRLWDWVGIESLTMGQRCSWSKTIRFTSKRWEQSAEAHRLDADLSGSISDSAVERTRSSGSRRAPTTAAAAALLYVTTPFGYLSLRGSNRLLMGIDFQFLNRAARWTGFTAHLLMLHSNLLITSFTLDNQWNTIKWFLS